MATRFKQILVCSFLLIATVALSQFNPEKKAFNKIKKGQWNTARKILDKSLQKDSLNIEALYCYSVLYFTPYYALFNVDTANYYNIKSFVLYEEADIKLKDRLKKFPIDSTVLAIRKNKIDSAAFEKVKNIDTEESYIHFLTFFPRAFQTQQAIELRDEAAFGNALKLNTHFAFQKFLEKYPTSHRAAEAQQRFDKLLYAYETKNKSLAEFRQFVKLYPESPYKEAAIQNIFDKTTLDGSEKSFDTFILEYPNSGLRSYAEDILFHIKLARQEVVQLNDSLKSIYPLEDWIPIAENGLWGFMNANGETVFKPTLKEINEDYFCDLLQSDFIQTHNQILSRNRKEIFSGKIKSTTDIGYGFIKIESEAKATLVHKSGRVLHIDGLRDAIILGGQFIACRNSNRWGIYSFTGKEVIPFIYDQISTRELSVILTKSGKEVLLDIKQILPYSRGEVEPIVADEIKRYGSKYYWVRNGALEELLDLNLKEIIPFDRHQLTFESVGVVLHKNNYHYLKNWPSLENEPLETYKIFEPWLITRKTGDKPSLHFIPTQQTIKELADSIWFDQSLVGIMKRDTIRLFQSPDKSFSIPINENYSIRKSKDSVVFIMIKTRNKTNVHLASNFEKIMTTAWLEVEPVLKNIFIVKDKGKQGLIDDKNKIILTPEYDALLYANGIFTLLKDRKFGTFNPITRKLLKPNFETNLIKYNQDWIIGRKANQFALVNPDEPKKTVFEFEEINFWSDSIAQVKMNGKRALYSIVTGKIIFDNMETFQIINESTPERLAIFSQNNLFGLTGTRSGMILNPMFEELTYLPVNNTLIFVGMKSLSNKDVEIDYINIDGESIKKITTDIESGYSILCDN